MEVKEVPSSPSFSSILNYHVIALTNNIHSLTLHPPLSGGRESERDDSAVSGGGEWRSDVRREGEKGGSGRNFFGGWRPSTPLQTPCFSF